jgi:hypothetical protein
MNSFLLRTITLVAFGLAAISANATTYSVNENFTGTYVMTDIGNGHVSIVHNLVFSSLPSGDASMFSSSSTTTVSDANLSEPFTNWCNAGCSFTETLINGNTFSGLVNFTDILREVNGTGYSGNFNITGGTGLFAGATGSGTFSGFDDFNGGTTNHNAIFTVTTVPEPETYGMMLVGLGLMGFVARRQKNEQA